MGSQRKLTIKNKRHKNQPSMILEFTLLQDCMDGWTLDKFELTVQGIENYQFIVDQFTTPQLPVCSSSNIVAVVMVFVVVVVVVVVVAIVVVVIVK